MFALKLFRSFPDNPWTYSSEIINRHFVQSIQPLWADFLIHEYSSPQLPPAVCALDKNRQEAMAKLNIRPSARDHTTAPEETCNCGYHAYNRKSICESLSEQESASNIARCLANCISAIQRRLVVPCIVDLSGKIIEHQNGYRAQYCEIIAVVNYQTLLHFIIEENRISSRKHLEHSQYDRGLLGFLEGNPWRYRSWPTDYEKSVALHLHIGQKIAQRFGIPFLSEKQVFDMLD